MPKETTDKSKKQVEYNKRWYKKIENTSDI